MKDAAKTETAVIMEDAVVKNNKPKVRSVPYVCSCGSTKFYKIHAGTAHGYLSMLPFAKLFQCRECGRYFTGFLGLWFEKHLF